MTLILTVLAVLAGLTLLLAVCPQRRKQVAYGAAFVLAGGAFGLANGIPTVGGDAMAQPGCTWDGTTLTCLAPETAALTSSATIRAMGCMACATTTPAAAAIPAVVVAAVGGRQVVQVVRRPIRAGINRAYPHTGSIVGVTAILVHRPEFLLTAQVWCRFSPTAQLCLEWRHLVPLYSQYRPLGWVLQLTTRQLTAL